VQKWYAERFKMHDLPQSTANDTIAVVAQPEELGGSSSETNTLIPEAIASSLRTAMPVIAPKTGGTIEPVIPDVAVDFPIDPPSGNHPTSNNKKIENMLRVLCLLMKNFSHISESQIMKRTGATQEECNVIIAKLIESKNIVPIDRNNSKYFDKKFNRNDTTPRYLIIIPLSNVSPETPKESPEPVLLSPEATLQEFSKKNYWDNTGKLSPIEAKHINSLFTESGKFPKGQELKVPVIYSEIRRPMLSFIIEN